MSTSSTTPAMPSACCSIKAAAALSGLSERTCWRLVAEGHLHTFKDGRRTLFDLDEILALVATDHAEDVSPLPLFGNGEHP